MRSGRPDGRVPGPWSGGQPHSLTMRMAAADHSLPGRPRDAGAHPAGRGVLRACGGRGGGLCGSMGPRGLRVSGINEKPDELGILADDPATSGIWELCDG